MSRCPTFGGAGSSGIAEALRVVDCMSGEAASFAFSRLFGANAVLGAALTAVLTLYIAFYAVGLLAGRASLGAASLTPRMMTLGLALTFATSWVAYQSVIWNLLSAAPDQIASLLVGTRGSATAFFADQLDRISISVVNAARGAEALQSSDQPGSIASVPNMLWLSALLLILGTVGVLLVSRIALAAVLALGPIFIICGLFEGTRGLLEGWLKAAVMFALTPLICVLLGGATIEMLGPLIDSINAAGGDVPAELAGTLFVGSAVYCALMLIALKTASTVVFGWRLPLVRSRSDTTLQQLTATKSERFEQSGPISLAADPQHNEAGRRVSDIVRAASVGSMVRNKTASASPSASFQTGNRPYDPVTPAASFPKRDPRIGGMTRRAHSPQERSSS